MAEMLKDGLAWLADKLKAVNARNVLYQRGAKAVLVKAVIGRSTFDRSEVEGAQRVFTDKDFLIKREDLVFVANEEAEPERGDRIIDYTEEGTFTYEVSSPREEPWWRWSDPERIVRRVHTKLIAGP